MGVGRRGRGAEEGEGGDKWFQKLLLMVTYVFQGGQKLTEASIDFLT